LLGRTVACQHCGAEFTATASDDPTYQIDEGHRLMDRVERALRKAEQQVNTVVTAD
jgi:hypothetical protein